MTHEERRTDVFFGGSGRLGKEFLIKNPNYLAPTSLDVDITNEKQVCQYIHDVQAATVIHAAAVVGFREAESNPEHAYRVNVCGTRAVAQACREAEARLVYISTVAVFNGKKGMYKESDIPHPAYYYGWTKLLGEQAVLMLADAAVVRTDFFVPGMFKYKEAYTDHHCSKLPAAVVAEAVEAVAHSNFCGIIHIGGPRDTLFNILRKHDREIRGILTADSSIPNFPKDLSMDSKRFHTLYPNILPR